MRSVRQADRRQSNRTDATDANVRGVRIKTFFSGVMALSLSTALVKVIGLFYKIPMLRYLTSVGMGYFNAAYEWYAMLSVLFTAGLPIAASMLIAQQISRAEHDSEALDAVRRIERLSMRIFFWLGLLGSLALYFGAGQIARLIDSPMTVYALKAVSPTVFFSCISASYRGYFQGFQNMIPTAVSQMIEAAGKLAFGVLFARLAVASHMDVAYVAALAMLGLSLGVAISCAYLWGCRRKQAMTCNGGYADIALSERQGLSLGKRLLAIAVPITLSSFVLSITKIVDMTMILRRLQRIGHSVERANSLYGIYTTMAVPIFNLVPALLTSVSLALIPTLSSQI
ncbi:MAG: oligosaccharide flippase family protein, partial [Clostridia bacterium]|nr:oligosaccharide flippase family protein [Clostridia bacterium]